MKLAGHVYVIENAISLVKIGYTSTPSKRIKEIESASGIPVEIKYISQPTDKCREIESTLHALFDKHRKKGEWFDIQYSTAIKALESILPQTTCVTPFDIDYLSIRRTPDNWLFAKDTCLTLGIHKSALKSLNNSESKQYKDMLTINESGLYSLIFHSNNPKFLIFQNWVNNQKSESNTVIYKDYERMPAHLSQKSGRGRVGKIDTCRDCGDDFIVRTYNACRCKTCADDAQQTYSTHRKTNNQG